MRMRSERELQVLRRVRDFLATTELSPPLESVAKQVEELGGVVDRLASHAMEQDASDRASRSLTQVAHEQARTLRRDFLRPVAWLSRVLFPSDEAVRQSLAMPLARDYEGLIAAAEAMTARAAEHSERFVAAGFNAEFVDRLKRAALDLRKMLDQEGAHLGHRSAATARMEEEIVRGRDLVRYIDALVTPQLEATPDRLAEWRTIARIARATADSPAPTPVPTLPNQTTPEAHAA
jgi:hypothetical protein